MGKQVTFYANREIVEAINGFVEKRGLVMVEKRGLSLGCTGPIPADKVFAESKLRKYLITDKLPSFDSAGEWLLDHMSHLSVTLLMQGVPTYDSRVWFQTGGNPLEKEGEALLRKVRTVIKKQSTPV